MTQIDKDDHRYFIASKIFMEMQKKGIFQMAFSFHGGGDEGVIERNVMIYHSNKINLSDIPTSEYTLTQMYPPDESSDIDTIVGMVQNEQSFKNHEIEDFLYTDCINESFDGEPMVEGTLVIDLIEAKIVKVAAYEVTVKELQLPQVMELPSLRTSVISSDLASEI